MNEQEVESGQAEEEKPAWQPLSSRQRRVLGVLVEKAKTTPDGYPMSLNAVTTGCNQKSNRSPLMNLSHDDVDAALEELRQMGAVAEVQSGGRVPKYRHYMKDWLGIGGAEIAVVAELLLRGQQTVGELRGRAARMDKSITDLTALRPTLDSLMEKNLVIALTPEGRGQVVTHRLYKDREMEELVSTFEQQKGTEQKGVVQKGAVQQAARPAPTVPQPVSPVNSVTREEFEKLENQVAEIRHKLDELLTKLGE